MKPLRPVAVLASTLCLAASVSAQSTAPSEEAEALARELLEVSRRSDMPLVIELLKIGTQSGELAAALVEELDFDELIEALVPIYAQQMTPDELRAAIEFYRSQAAGFETGQAPRMPLAVTAVILAWAKERIPQTLEALASQDIDAPVLDAIRLRKTLEDLIRAGGALMSWLTDRLQHGHFGFKGQRGSERASWRVRGSSGLGHGNSYSVVPYGTVRKLLVPKYLAMLPEKDGWGQTYQFAINASFRAAAVVGVRSPGKDGVFDTDDYVRGLYDIEVYENDIVWVDGFIARGPTRLQAAEELVVGTGGPPSDVQVQAAPDAESQITGAAMAQRNTAIRTFNEGAKALEGGDAERALQKLRLAAVIDPQLAEAHYAIAGIHYQHKRFPQALEAIEKLLELEPGHVAGRRLHFMIHVARGNTEAANAAFEIYLQSETNLKRLSEDSWSFFNSGHALWAEKAALRILQIVPDEPQAHYLLGLIYVSADPAKAKRHLRRFVELAPDHPEAEVAKRMLSYL